jgi:T5SS/PEP-CTERM-associated repeat protein
MKKILLLLSIFTLMPSHMTKAAVTSSGDVAPNPPEELTSLEIGATSYGTFRIDGGTEFESYFVNIGSGTYGYGTATVTDSGSIWRLEGAYVGQSGYGKLTVKEGGVAIVGSSVEIGSNGPGHGVVEVDGVDSLLQTSNQLTIGQSASGDLAITDGGVVNVPNGQTRVGPAGRIMLDGGLLRTSYLENSGVISGSGIIEVYCCGSSLNYGRYQVEEGDHLQLRFFSSGDARNQGEYLIHGGELEIFDRLQNENLSQRQGVIELSQGTLRVGPTSIFSGQEALANRGLITAISGENHLYGSIRNEFGGQIALTNNSLTMFHNDVYGLFGSKMSVSAGASAIFLQDLDINGGVLLADIAGAEGYGHVEVLGDFNFSGNLQVNLDDSYVPQLGDSFSIARVSGNITGSPNTLLPELSEGLSWEMTFEPHELLLSVIAAPALPGDFDFDGDVDGRDFLTWQRNTNVGDLADWQANYGVGTLTANSTAVPEPTCFVLYGIFMILTPHRRVLRFPGRDDRPI